MRQTANAVGGSVIVQIQGDGNTLIAGQPHLNLTRRAGLSRRIRTDPDTGKPNEIDIIRPFARSIELVGREAELSELHDWLAHGQAISVRVMTGGAGLGKTRLAIELIEEMALRGWRAGFLTRTELARFRGQRNLAPWDWNAPVLAVMDYASASASDLRAWLGELANHPVWDDAAAGRERPLRLLLLERHAVCGNGWWATTFGRGQEAAVLEQLLEPAKPVTLRPLDDPDQRRAVLTRTLERLGCGLIPPGNDEFDRRLAELTWGGTPLFLMMAAVMVARADFGHVLTMASDKLALNIAETELSRIRKVAESHGTAVALGPLVEHLTAVATLRQGLTADNACEVIAREAAALGYGLPAGPAALRDALAAALPDEMGGVAAVGPDMIGEAVLLSVWQGKTGALPAIGRAHAAEPVATMQTVIRTCQDYVMHGHRDPLSWIRRIFDARADLKALMELADAMPRHTVELREVAVEVAQSVTNLIDPLARETRDVNLLDALATSFNNLSNHLSAVARWREALTAVEAAVAIRRGLAAAHPEAFRPDLAVALSNLSNRLSETGRREEALRAIQEAAALYRDMAEAHPDAFRPDSATSLHNLSNRPSNLGRLEEALAAAEEAVAMRRDLSQAHPDAFRSDLATALINLSSCMSGVGRWARALAAIEEAVAIWRDLAAARPDAFRPDLGKSLNSLSNRLSETGRREDALAAAEEALAIQRDLSAASYSRILVTVWVRRRLEVVA